jgi:hypothetical protein
MTLFESRVRQLADKVKFVIFREFLTRREDNLSERKFWLAGKVLELEAFANYNSVFEGKFSLINLPLDI